MYFLSTKWLFIFMVIGTSANTECPDGVNPGRCQCDKSHGGDKIWCPSQANHDLHIFVGPAFVEIECNSKANSSNILEHLREIDLSGLPTVDYLKFDKCPSPDGVSYGKWVKTLGLKNVLRLNLHYTRVSGKEGLFIPGQFENIPGLKNLIVRLTVSPNDPFSTTDILRGLESVLHLELTDNSIKTISENFLNHLPVLKDLAINENEIISLPPKLLETPGASLKKLKLTLSSLKMIPNDFFIHSTELESFSFDKNALTTLSESLFHPLIRLKTLDTSGNLLNLFEKRALEKCRELESINWSYFCLSNCSIISLKNFIGKTKSLKIFKTRWNKGSKLVFPPDLFSEASALEEISITDGKFETLPANLIKNHANLKTLRLNRNEIENIPEGFLDGLSELEKLDLSRNELQILPPKLFDHLRSIEKLSLSRNKLNHLDKDLFRKNIKLQELYLSRNSLSFDESQEPDWSSLGRLKKLDLSHNRISIARLSSDIRWNLLSLQSLDLSNNNIGPMIYAEEFFRLQQNTLYLNLKDNQISVIGKWDEPLKVTGDITVSLENNPIKCDCRNLKLKQKIGRSSENSIYIVDIETLKCFEQNKTFLNTPESEFSCEIPSETYPNEICPCNRCKYSPSSGTLIVNCSELTYKTLPSELPIKEARKIVLDMSSNELQNINNPLTYGLNITELILTKNKIRKIDSEILKNEYSNLKTILLDSNDLATLSPDALNWIKDRRIFMKLSNNAFPCNCDSEELYNFVKSNKELILDVDSLTLMNCDLGLNLPILSISDDDEFCQSNEVVVATYALPVAFILLLFLISLVICLWYKKTIVIILYQYPLFRKYFIKKENAEDLPYDVFVGYSHLDKEYVEEELVQGLEFPEDDSGLKYRCILGDRDFIPGAPINEQILQAVDNSSRTIIVLSEAFLSSDWAQYEFDVAHRKNKVILVKYGSLPESKLGSVIKNYIQGNTYIDHTHANFWRNLRYALPHKGHSRLFPSWLSRVRQERIKLDSKRRKNEDIIPTVA